jgi:hypothetical protein
VSNRCIYADPHLHALHSRNVCLIDQNAPFASEWVACKVALNKVNGIQNVFFASIKIRMRCIRAWNEAMLLEDLSEASVSRVFLYLLHKPGTRKYVHVYTHRWVDRYVLCTPACHVLDEAFMRVLHVFMFMCLAEYI